MEFAEVMRQWKRMCECFGGCSKCPLYDEDGFAHVLCSEGGIRSAEPETVEKVVEAWTAEHPEPVYPTWFEVLEQMGVAGMINCGEPFYDSQDREVYLPQAAFTPKVFEPIPADIAQKLGIEPKEEG